MNKSEKHLDRKQAVVDAILYWQCQIESCDKMIVFAKTSIEGLTKEFNDIETEEKRLVMEKK